MCTAEALQGPAQTPGAAAGGDDPESARVKATIAHVAKYAASSECVDRFETARVSTELVRRWQEEAVGVVPARAAQQQLQWQVLRACFLTFLMDAARRDDQAVNEAYAMWSRCCALLDAAVEADHGLDDPVLIGTVVLGLTCKLESQYATIRDAELLHIYAHLERQCQKEPLGRVPVERGAAAFRAAERSLLKALGWALPTIDTYTCLEGLLLRAQIAGNGQFAPGEVERHGHVAIQRAVMALLSGHRGGYALARTCLLAPCGPELLACLELVAPPPAPQTPLP